MGGNGPVAVEISCSSSMGTRVMGTSTGFAIFRAPIFPPFGAQGLHLCGLRFLHFPAPKVCIFLGSGFSIFRCPGFASLQAPVFLFFGLQFLHFLAPEVCIFSGFAFFIFRAPVSAFLSTWGVYLFRLLFLFFGLRFLHFSAPELCIFLGSAFSTFWAPPGTLFGIWGLHFCRLCFCPFRAPVFAILGTRGLFHFGLRFLHPKFASLWLQFLHSRALLVTV